MDGEAEVDLKGSWHEFVAFVVHVSVDDLAAHDAAEAAAAAAEEEEEVEEEVRSAEQQPTACDAVEARAERQAGERQALAASHLRLVTALVFFRVEGWEQVRALGRPGLD